MKINGTTTGKTKYSYDTQGKITQLRNYRSATDYTIQTLSYDGGAQATQIETQSVKNADGANAESTEGFTAGTIAERYTYNTRGWPTAYIDGKGRTTTIVYDDTGRITRVNYPDGSADCYSYDTANNTVTYTNANNYAVTYEYNPFGNLIELYEETSEQAIATYAYDSLGNRVLETLHSTNSAKDQSTYTYYDGLGRLLEIGIRNTDGTNTPLESYTYQAARGKTTQTVHGSTGAPDQVSTAYVDGMGNVIHTGRMYNGVEYTDTYAYDYLGNRTQETSAYTVSRGGTYSMQYEYDHMGNVLRATNALGDSEINTYDWTGNLVTSQDNKGNTTSYSYDKLGRLLTVTTPIDNGRNSVVKYYYDAAGNLTSQLTSSGTSSSSNQFTSVLYTYDSMNRLTGVEMPVNSAASDYSAYTYDPAGNILTVKTGYRKTGNSLTGTPSTTSYTYDRFGNVLTITDPVGKTETYTYDLNGSVLTKRDRKNTLTTYTYDNRGRLTGETIGSSISRSYTYGLNGSLLSQSEGSGTITYVYDALGRKTQETAGGYTKNYTYNIGNLRTNFTVKQSGTTLLNNSYTYDDLGRMTRVSGSGVTADYTFDDNSNLSTVAYNNGVTQSYTYNAGNLVTQTTSATTADTLSRYQYSYDLAGRQIGITDLENRVTTYQYDSQGRLTSESRTAGSAGGTAYAKSYTYDSYGNRATMTADGETTTYEYNLANRLLYCEIDGEYTDYYYDANGNLIEKQPSFIIPVSYVQNGQSALETQAVDNFAAYYSYYNEANQLVMVSDTNPRAQYTYYADGLRKSKNSTTYVWDGDQLVLEISSSTVKKYIRGLTLAGCVTGSTKSYYQYDAHGNVVQLTNASGVVTQSYDYDAFGNQFSPSLTDSNMFRYSGEYFDKETDFYYLRARQYSPAIGRFTQEDTYRGEYASPLSLNLYTYCCNDPVQYVDPTGHFAWDTFVDVISFSSSFATFVVNPTKENLLWAAIDAAALMIPNVSSPMLRAGAATVGEALAKTSIPDFIEAAGGFVEAVTKAADDIVAAAKQADNADDVVVKAKTGRGQSRPISQRLIEGESNLASSIKSADLIFESRTKSAYKLMNEMDKRGWTKKLIRETVENPYTTRVSFNKATGNEAVAFYTERGAYVVVDAITKEVIQVSDNFNPSTWLPDSSIINPYIPK